MAIRSLTAAALAACAFIALPMAESIAEDGKLVREAYGGHQHKGWAHYECERPNDTATSWGCNIGMEQLAARKGRLDPPKRNYKLLCVADRHSNPRKFSTPTKIEHSLLAGHHLSCYEGNVVEMYAQYQCINNSTGHIAVFNVLFDCHL